MSDNEQDPDQEVAEQDPEQEEVPVEEAEPEEPRPIVQYSTIVEGLSKVQRTAGKDQFHVSFLTVLKMEVPMRSAFLIFLRKKCKS